MLFTVSQAWNKTLELGIEHKCEGIICTWEKLVENSEQEAEVVPMVGRWRVPGSGPYSTGVMELFSGPGPAPSL